MFVVRMMVMIMVTHPGSKCLDPEDVSSQQTFTETILSLHLS